MKKWVGGFLIMGMVMAGGAAASEGTVEMFNVAGEEGRCWAGSILTISYQYKLIVSCRDLIYPASGAEVFNYALWVVPADGKEPQKLGVLGVGKAEFATATRFSSLMVTKEVRQQGLGQKTGPVVMRGDVRPIGFLETGIGIPTPTLVASGALPSPMEVKGSGQVATKGVQLGVTILKVVGVAFVLGIGAIVVVILVSSLGSKKNVPPGL